MCMTVTLRMSDWLSHRLIDRLLLRIQGVAVLSRRTLDALVDVTQTRRSTVGPVGARNRIGILQNKTKRVDDSKLNEPEKKRTF